MLIDSGAQYPFVIMNTVQVIKNLHPKKEIFLFDSFDFDGFKEFALQNDQKVLNKILYVIKNFNKKDNKITLINVRFSMKEYEKIKNMNRLSETTIDLLHLMNEYEKKHRHKNEVIVHLVDNQLQMIERDTCRRYQIYFYVNFFNQLENSGIINEEKSE